MKTTTILTLSLAGLLAACATTPPPPELIDARTKYQEASTAPGANYATVELHEAQVALSEAEKKNEDSPASDTAKDAAYVASRKAVAARAKAGAMSAVEAKKEAEKDLVRFKDNQAQATKTTLEQTKGALGSAQQQASSERAGRLAAEEKANAALAQIAGMNAQKNEKGYVLTLNGSVLFETGKSVLLPGAKQRLNDVAKALKEDARKISILGHTDSVGADDMNQRLSQSRAEAVRTYLVSQGVPTDRIRAEGMGETSPIASNETPDGRANNRRVEIVLEDAK